jgi:hypothetical protein
MSVSVERMEGEGEGERDRWRIRVTETNRDRRQRQTNNEREEISLFCGQICTRNKGVMMRMAVSNGSHL